MLRLMTWLNGFSSASSRKPMKRMPSSSMNVSGRPQRSGRFATIKQADAELVASFDEEVLLIRGGGHLRADDLRDSVLAHDLHHLVRAAEAGVAAAFQLPRVVVAQDADGPEAHVASCVPARDATPRPWRRGPRARFSPSAPRRRTVVPGRPGQVAVRQEQHRVQRRHENRREHPRDHGVLGCHEVDEQQSRAEDRLVHAQPVGGEPVAVDRAAVEPFGAQHLQAGGRRGSPRSTPRRIAAGGGPSL